MQFHKNYKQVSGDIRTDTHMDTRPCCWNVHEKHEPFEMSCSLQYFNAAQRK
jgi:hypothetical protein